MIGTRARNNADDRNGRDAGACRTRPAGAAAASLALRYACFNVAIRAPRRAYQPSAIAGNRLNYGNLRRDNRGNRPGVRGPTPAIDRAVSHSHASHRNAAYGPGTSRPVAYYTAQARPCSNVGVCLGMPAFDSRPGLGPGSDLALFRLLVLLSDLAPARMVEGNRGDLLHTCFSECPACNRRGGRPVKVGDPQRVNDNW